VEYLTKELGVTVKLNFQNEQTTWNDEVKHGRVIVSMGIHADNTVPTNTVYDKAMFAKNPYSSTITAKMTEAKEILGPLFATKAEAAETTEA